MDSQKLGELMLKQELITKEQLSQANKLMKIHGGISKLVTYLLDQGVTKSKVEEFFLTNFNISSVNLASFEVDDKVISIFSKENCEKYCVIPVAKVDNILVVASADPTNNVLKENLGHLARGEVKLVLADEYQIKDSIEFYYVTNKLYSSLLTKYETEALKEEEDKKEDTLEIIDDDYEDNKKLSTVIKFVNLLLLDSMKKGASDIHIEPFENDFRIRFRIDGVLREIIKPEKAIAPSLINRIKVISNLAIEEKRKPQDGRIKVGLKNGQILEFRVSILPTQFGEKAVLRLLKTDGFDLSLNDLGFEAHQLTKFRKAIYQPHGIVLLTGPTGSGKTTTIYSALNELNKPEVNISTVEDPVEINLKGINQVQVNKKVDLDFATALRSFLRQDPDIMMLGEIRDVETAEIAIKAALTGHLVISTIHTNDAPSTVTRLLDMGIKSFLVASSVNIVVAQRLVKKVCPHCAKIKRVPDQTLLDLGLTEQEVKNAQIMEGDGCHGCNNTGYLGRVAIYEVFSISDMIRDAIFAGKTQNELKKMAVSEGMQTLRRSSLNRLIEGVTTIKEVMKVCYTDESSVDKTRKAS